MVQFRLELHDRDIRPRLELGRLELTYLIWPSHGKSKELYFNHDWHYVTNKGAVLDFESSPRSKTKTEREFK